MGKSEINPIIVSDTESDSSDSSDDSSSEGETVLQASSQQTTDTGRGRSSQRMATLAYSPWAPQPYLRRSWTPDRHCPQQQADMSSKKSSARQYKRSQSAEEPCCSLTVPKAEPPAGGACCSDTECSQKTAGRDKKGAAASTAMKRWVVWHMYMKHLADQMYEDAYLTDEAHSCSLDDSEAVSCDSEDDVCNSSDEPVQNKKVQFAESARTESTEHDENVRKESTKTDEKTDSNSIDCTVTSCTLAKDNVYPKETKVEHEKKQRGIRSKIEAPRKTFRQMVRALKPSPWMFKVLTNHGILEAKDADMSAFISNLEEDKNAIHEKRQKFRQVMHQIGPKPWMVELIHKEAQLLVKKTKAIETRANKIKKRNEIQSQRQEFRQLVRMLGPHPWMLKVLANNGLPEAEEVEFPVPILSPVNKVELPEKRKQLREMIKKYGAQPWMVCVVNNQAIWAAKRAQKAACGNSNEGKESAETLPNKAEVKIQIQEQRREFRKLVQQLGPNPWMLKVLVNNGINKANDVEYPVPVITPTDETELDTKTEQLTEMIKKLGPQPWMVRVVINQAIFAYKRTQKVAVNNKCPVQEKQEKKGAFRKIVREMTVKPWMFKVLGNNGVPEARDIDLSQYKFGSRDEECQLKVKRQQFRQAVRQMGPQPWMLNVLMNQSKWYTKRSIENTENSCEEKKDVKEKRIQFRKFVRKIGPGLWMLEVLTNSGVPQGKNAEVPAKLPENHENVDENRKQLTLTIKKLGPEPWMRRVVINQVQAVKKKQMNHSDKSSSEAESGTNIKMKENVCNNRKVFREAVKKMGPKPWMLKVLLNKGLHVEKAKQEEIAAVMPMNKDDHSQTKQKRQEFCQIIKRTGPKPWMLNILVNKSQRVKQMESTDKKEFEIEIHTNHESDDNTASESELKVECEKIRKKRKAFRELVRQMGPKPWMMKVLANNGLLAAHGKEIDVKTLTGNNTDTQGQTVIKRQEFRRYIREIGTKAWMIKVIMNQASQKSQDVQADSTDDEKMVKDMHDEMKKNKKEFRQTVKIMNPHPWMLRVLANHGVQEAEDVDLSIFEVLPSENQEAREQKRKAFRMLIRKIGPRAWMVRVIVNLAKIMAANQGFKFSERSETEQPPYRSEKIQLFKQIIKDLGPEPWMVKEISEQSENQKHGKHVQDIKSGETSVGADESSPNSQTRKPVFRKVFLQMMKQMREQQASSEYPVFSEESDEDESDDCQMRCWYEQMGKQMAAHPELIMNPWMFSAE